MLRNIGIVLVVGAALCALPPLIGWAETGQFAWPGFSIGGLLEHLSLANRLGPLDPFIRPIMPYNPGWVLLLLGVICYMAASRKVE